MITNRLRSIITKYPGWHRIRYNSFVVKSKCPASVQKAGGVSGECMKAIAQLRLTILVVGLMAAQALRAAEPDTKAAVALPEAQAAVADRPPAVSLPDPKLVPAGDIPEIKLPTHVELPASVRGLAADFRSQAQQYVERQKVLSARAETATAAERERIREQIKANRAQFLQQTRQIRSEIKDRIREVHRSIGNSRPLDGAAAERGAGSRRRR